MEPCCQILSQLHTLSVWQILACIPALVLLLSAIAAVALRNLFHCALCLTLSFVALGVLFIALGAEFIGFVQITVCVGAVAVLIVFAILLTSPEQVVRDASPFSGEHSIKGSLVAWAVLVALLVCIFLSPRARGPESLAVKPGDASSGRLRLPAYYVEATRWKQPVHPVEASIETIGENLVGKYMVPLQATGLLLTAALIGAALLAKEKRRS